MRQLEIEFFFPLTEQITLPLDFTPCIKYQEEKRKSALIGAIDGYAGTVLSIGATGATTWTVSNNLPPATEVKISPNDKSVGKYRVGNSNFYIHLGEKPNALTRWAMKHVFKFHWIDM